MRIGHGVRSMEDGALVDRLAREGVPLELCPTSNLNTHIFAGIGAYPIRQFLRSGVRVTVNTDNMTVSGVTLESEFQKLIKPSGFDVNLEENLLKVVYDNDMQDQVVFICLQPEPLRRIKELGSDIPTVYTMFFAWGHIEDVAFSDAFSIEERNIIRTLVDNIHSAGKQVFVWTVNNESQVQYLVDCGVDGIVTDDPVMMRNALNKVNYSGGLSKLLRCFTNLFSEGL